MAPAWVRGYERWRRAIAGRPMIGVGETGTDGGLMVNFDPAESA